MREAFFDKIKEPAKNNKDIFILGADLGMKFFADLTKEDPKRFVNVGVSEQNMIGLAAGLALSGKNVYCYSIIPFLIMRPFEQIRNDICFHNLNVRLLGAGGGLVYGFEGITHFATEDIAIMRALPNMTVVCPGNKFEAENIAEESLNHQGPLYVRFGVDMGETIYEKGTKFKIGKGIIAKEGKDVCIIATGTALSVAKDAIEILKEKKYDFTLISMHTIKPLDEELIKDCAKNYKAIFTIEDHNIIGGLGSAVSEVLLESGYKGIFKRIGIPDKNSPFVGSFDYLMKQFGLDSESIALKILKEYKNA